MPINKVIINDELKLDLTADTVTPETLAEGTTAHDKSGAAIVGTAEFGGGGGGGSIPSATKKDVNFYDYDGTVLYSYTVAEAAALTELPALPSHDGLVCQGWNWTLDGIKAMGRAVNVGAMYITDDGKTRIYITLQDGRTSPMLGCCPNGTVTVDWGDGTEPDVLTGAGLSSVKWTPTHEYAAPGDYMIEITVDGEMGLYGIASANGASAILRYSSSDDARNRVYQNAVKKVEIGNGVTKIGSSSFFNCYNLSSIVIPAGVKNIDNYTFQNCYNLSSIIIPAGVTSIDNYAFQYCNSLSSIIIPAGVTSIGNYAFYRCYSLTSIVIPNSVTSIGNYVFSDCNSLLIIVIPDGVTRILENTLNGCYSLSSIIIPAGVTSIGNYAFQYCNSLSSIIIPAGVTYINPYVFNYCYGVKYYDFSHHTAVPNLLNKNAFSGIAADCEIRVPTALVDEWKAATNWATYADHIVGV